MMVEQKAWWQEELRAHILIHKQERALGVVGAIPYL